MLRTDLIAWLGGIVLVMISLSRAEALDLPQDDKLDDWKATSLERYVDQRVDAFKYNNPNTSKALTVAAYAVRLADGGKVQFKWKF